MKSMLLEQKSLPNTVKIGLFFVFCFFLGGGIGHFISPDSFVRIMPNYISPGLHLPAVYISGFFEILGAFGLIHIKTRRWAGYGLIALVICVTPANVFMWTHPGLFPEVPESILGARLFMQVLLLLSIAWATQDRSE